MYNVEVTFSWNIQKTFHKIHSIFNIPNTVEQEQEWKTLVARETIKKYACLNQIKQVIEVFVEKSKWNCMVFLTLGDKELNEEHYGENLISISFLRYE